MQRLTQAISGHSLANIMHHARAPMKYFHGYSREDLESHQRWVWFPNENAKIGAEHSGGWCRAHRAKDMEFQMQAMGLVHLSLLAYTTGDMIDENKTTD